MHHFWSIEDVHLHNSWLTIGSFDGVHIGHQEIVRRLIAGAHKEGVQAVVLTFYPHPAAVLGRRSGSFYLTDPEQRSDILGEMGVDYVITHPFNLGVANKTARQFMEEASIHLGVKHLLVGYDFALGRGREGNVPKLQKLGEDLGYSVEVFPPVEIDGEVVSSSKIRSYLAEGDVARAAKLLGRPYRLEGLVVVGDGRGRTIGIPTANLDVWKESALPKAGVYVCRAIVGGKAWGAVANVGVRPTFKEWDPSTHVEAHLLDFQGSLYDQHIQLEFLAHLRDEQRFPNATALVEQIHQDIARSREIL